jgi:hypothetical protein
MRRQRAPDADLRLAGFQRVLEMIDRKFHGFSLSNKIFNRDDAKRAKLT